MSSLSGSELVGARVQRVEDQRLLTGRGRYVDDVLPRGTLHAAFVRSHVAHGRVQEVEVGAASRAPGVVAVLTAADLDGMVEPLRPTGPPELATPAYTALASGKVRFVGEPLVMVVAETRALAEDACDLVAVHVEPLPAVITIEDAVAAGGPVLFEELGTNVLFRRTDTYGDPDTAFARADRVVTERFEQQRMANLPLEGRAGLADYAPERGELVYHVAHQNPHALRVAIAAHLHHPEERTIVRCGDIGGSFGQKAYLSREDLCVCAASRALGRPVKWIEDRAENLLAAGHARDERIDVSLAVTGDGRILGARVALVVKQGAYQPTALPASIFVNLVRVLFPNAYRIRHYAFEGTVVASNTAPYVAFRAPWESETWARERMLDVVARVLRLEPIEIRLRNLVTPDEQPTTLVTGPTVQHMTARATLERAAELVDVASFRREQAAARAVGRFLGLGVAVFAEAAPGPPDFGAALGAGSSPRSAQEARAAVARDGTVQVFTSQQPHGQGHETTLAQLTAEVLGVPLEQVAVVHGDTARTPFNAVGTGGSRAATLASGAVIGAARALRQRIIESYAQLHELDPLDVDLVHGVVRAQGVPASAWDLAQLAAAVERGRRVLPERLRALEATADFAIPDGGWTQATHCCWVEVDVHTGMVTVLRHLVVEDCGAMINPTIVEGQIVGGVAQGLATVLHEAIAYDEHGQLRTTTLLDYLVPTMAEIPPIDIEHLASAPQGPVDFRGAGESGAVGAPAALSNAVEDALAPFGARIRHKYLPPPQVLAAVREGMLAGQRYASPAPDAGRPSVPVATTLVRTRRRARPDRAS